MRKNVKYSDWRKRPRTPGVRSTMPNDELEINVVEYSSMGGEMKDMVGQTPALVVECLVYLLKKQAQAPPGGVQDQEAIDLLERLGVDVTGEVE